MVKINNFSFFAEIFRGLALPDHVSEFRVKNSRWILLKIVLDFQIKLDAVFRTWSFNGNISFEEILVFRS